MLDALGERQAWRLVGREPGTVGGNPAVVMKLGGCLCVGGSGRTEGGMLGHRRHATTRSTTKGSSPRTLRPLRGSSRTSGECRHSLLRWARRSRSSRWRQSTCSPTSRSSRASCWARPFSASQPGSFQRSPQGRAFGRLVQEPENPVSRRHRSLRGTCDPSVDLLTWEGVRQASSRLSGDTRRIRLMLARKSSQRCSWCRALKLSRAISRTAFRANRSSISSADPRSG